MGIFPFPYVRASIPGQDLWNFSDISIVSDLDMKGRWKHKILQGWGLIFFFLAVKEKWDLLNPQFLQLIFLRPRDLSSSSFMMLYLKQI